MSWVREMALREAVRRLIGLVGSSSGWTLLGSVASLTNVEFPLGDGVGGSPLSLMSPVGGFDEGDWLIVVTWLITGLRATVVGSEIRTGTKVGME
jgi:hypothetical protein